MQRCEYCGTEFPKVALSSSNFDRIVEVLSNGGKARAASEVQFASGIEMHQAQTWLDHLLSCIYTWPYSDADKAVLGEIDLAFSEIQKPEHFTNFTHCGECAEHDEVLLKRNRETLQRKDLGNAGWDPISFCSAEGIAYLFPTLARFALAPDIWSDNDWYVDQLLFHLSYQGPDNRFFIWCDEGKRTAVCRLLRHLAESRPILNVDSTRKKELDIATLTWRTLNSPFDTDVPARGST